MYPYISLSCIFLLTYASANENFMEEYTTFDDKGRDLLVQSSGRLRRTIDLNDEFIVAVRSSLKYNIAALFVCWMVFTLHVLKSLTLNQGLYHINSSIHRIKKCAATYTTYKNYITCIDVIYVIDDIEMIIHESGVLQTKYFFIYKL